MHPPVSVIVPSYNPGSKFVKCLESLDRLSEHLDIQAVLVDDCSTDASYDRILRFAAARTWVTPHQLKENSGSPSEPRNVGLTLATGEYVIYLDADDQILPEGVLAAYDLARRSGADFVRAPLIRVDEAGEHLMNTIDGWGDLRGAKAKAKTIVQFHSTTPTALFSRQFLIDRGLIWSTELHMAEDAVFLYQALAAGEVEYSDEPLYIYDATPAPGHVSATQRYGDAEMLNHIKAWSASQRILEMLGIDYFAVRGQVALQAVISSMIRNNREGFSREIFQQFGDLLRSHQVVAGYPYNDRFSEIRDHILADRFEEFLESIKQRMVIAGHDMKFVRPALSVLEEFYTIEFDEWTDHNDHDEGRSLELLAWADVIFCEWMLGNAVWYSERKLPRQTMIVRVHRFELTKDYGLDIDIDSVDRFLVIAPALMDELQLTFDIPRTKIAYVPNYLPLDEYVQGTDPDRVFRLAMVGIVPKLKGFHRALELLNELRKLDPRYTLTIFGNQPSDYPWVASDPDEMEYFQSCNNYIEECDLSEAVRFAGWVDPRQELQNIGFVLSLSDLEGSHVAAAEGFAAGAITVIRPWHGSEFLYPKKYVKNTLEESLELILDCRDFSRFESERAEGLRAIQKLNCRPNRNRN